MSRSNFADRLIDAIDGKRNPSIIGLDSDFGKLPGFMIEESRGKFGDGPEAAARCMLQFNKAIIDGVRGIVPAVKIQSAFYEQYGPEGAKAFLETAEYAKGRGLVVVGDVKRNDIGNTSGAYSNAYLGRVRTPGGESPMYDLDCITVNPYLGSDGVRPFLDDCGRRGKGIFVLVKTSNPSSSELQDVQVRGAGKLYGKVAGLVNGWGKGLVGKSGYSSVGAVVGATHPREAGALRKAMPKAVFLVPGYGAQGGGASDVVPCFNSDGRGALVHSARGVIFAYRKAGKEEDFAKAAAKAAESMRGKIMKALSEKGTNPY